MKSINIIIPMAGLGSRFKNAGYKEPKPFIDVKGKTMIERVLENLNTDGAKFILIARKEDLAKNTRLVDSIRLKYNVTFIEIDSLTEGTACTVLFARKYINNQIPLIIANSDQVVDFDIKYFIQDAENRNLDGSILTFIDDELNPKWSFAKLDENNLVTEVKEKRAISKYATVGIYYFKKGSDFVDSAIDMIIKNDRTNNEFYTCPTYNYLIDSGGKVGVYNVLFEDMHGLGTPDDLEKYLKWI